MHKEGYTLERQANNDEETDVIVENSVRPSTTENDNITEIISTPSQAESIKETITTINNKELNVTLRRDCETNYKVQSTSVISNARYLELSLSRTFSLVPSAFLVTFLIITFGISNPAISNFHYVKQIFRSLQLYYPAISNFFISMFDN